MRLTKAAQAAVLLLVAMGTMAPAAAYGDLWWFDHEQGRFPVSTDKKVAEPYLDEVVIKDANGKKIESCVIFVKGEIYSKYGGMGEGTFTESSAADECATDIEECKVTVQPVTSTAWTMTLQESETKVTIANFKLTIKREGKCPGTALPAESTPSGTVIGKFGDWDNPSGSPGRVIFNGKQELVDGGTKIFLDGYLRFGTKVTALPEPKGFTATSSPAKVDGERTEATVFTRSSRTIECLGATISATAENGDTTITATPTYSECTATALGTEYPATIKMNGCAYTLHLHSESTEGESYKFTAPTDLTCPEGKEVELDVFSSHANHTAGTVTCRFKLGETGNQGLNLVELTNKSSASAPAWMLAHLDVKEIDSKRTAGSVLICGPEFDTAGTLAGEFELNGTTDPGEKGNGIGVFPG